MPLRSEPFHGAIRYFLFGLIALLLWAAVYAIAVEAEAAGEVVRQGPRPLAVRVFRWFGVLRIAHAVFGAQVFLLAGGLTAAVLWLFGAYNVHRAFKNTREHHRGDADPVVEAPASRAWNVALFLVVFGGACGVGLLLVYLNRPPAEAPTVLPVAAPPPEARRPDPTPDKKRAPAIDVLAARQNFQTRLTARPARRGTPPDAPPPETFRLVDYPSPAGRLAAYLTPAPADGRKLPAVVWCHGGFGGIGRYLWQEGPPGNDQSARAFLDAGLVVLCPSWRGENANPGRFELFYGEVDDLLAAIDYLAEQPYVDPDRIYLAGHSTGGTLTLLGAAASRKVRAAFSFGGAPDVGRVVADGKGYGNTPYDPRSEAESVLRSPIYFAAALYCPTFYFEGEDSAYVGDASRMQEVAAQAGRPFKAFAVEDGDHFNILAPLTRLVARKVVQDAGPACTIKINGEEVREAFRQRRK
jgi:dienelactone hydrolase